MQFENYGTGFAFAITFFLLGILWARSIFTFFISSLDFNMPLTFSLH